MTEAEYWAFVDRHRPKSNEPDAHCRRLTAALAKLPADLIIGYERTFSGLVDRAYRADLWSAVYHVNGGCSDDGFVYFRWWLVGQGRGVYELALADPESLAEITAMSDREELEHESYGYVAVEAYRAATGEPDIPYDFPSERAPVQAQRLRGRWVNSDRGVRRKWPTLHRLMRRPPVIDPAWLSVNSGTAGAVARSIRANNAWADLPVLADALEDAGCADAFLLGHLRAGRPHARHCWALKLLLG